jgi:5-carboxymethyl-2-hydroxymuconate isomerase
MPHVIVEYSANLRDRLELPRLLESLHATAIGTGVFPIGGARTRAQAREDYRIADGHPDNGFVHVVLRIGHGRDLPTKQRASQAVFDALCAHLRPLFDATPLGVSLEVQEIDPVLTYKMNNLHDYVKARQAGRERP